MTNTRAGRPWGWTPDDYEMLTTLFQEGLGNDDIARAMDRTASTVSAALRRCELDRGATHCLSCGGPLAQPASGRRRVYCDNKCGQAYRSKADHEERVETEREALAAKPVCTECGLELTPEQIRRRITKGLSLSWCSGLCRQSSREKESVLASTTTELPG